MTASRINERRFAGDRWLWTVLYQGSAAAGHGHRNEPPSSCSILSFATSSHRADHGNVVYWSVMSPAGPCVTHRRMSGRAPSARAIEMNVRRASCCRRARSPMRPRSSWKRRSAWLALRGFPRRDGTIRSSGLGVRPVARSKPPSFHAARIFASVGCTGTRRVTSVFVRPGAANSRPTGRRGACRAGLRSAR